MAANVESMFYVRETPWHGLGERLEEAPTSADALRIAGLDWTVEQRDVYVQCDGNYQLVPHWKNNYRSTDGKSLGIVSDRYKICQNIEAFDFTDSLAGGGDIRYETAGSLREGKQIWLLAKLTEKRKILGEDFDNYLCFTNTHDGKGAIQCCVTPIRVVCNNTLNLALAEADFKWRTTHVGDIAGKLREAEEVLFHTGKYLDALDKEADRMANLALPDEDLQEMLRYLFPIKEDAGEEHEKNVKAMRGQFMACYFMPDIKQYKGTWYGAVNAMSDFVTHHNPQKQVKDYKAKRWGKVMNGHQLMTNMMKLYQIKASK